MALFEILGSDEWLDKVKISVNFNSENNRKRWNPFYKLRYDYKRVDEHMTNCVYIS